MAEKVKKKTTRAKATSSKKGKSRSPKKKVPTAAAKKRIEKPKSDRSRVKRGRAKRKNNLLKLCSEMNKYYIDAVDKEIVKRFKTLIDTSEEDITKTSLINILKDPGNTELSQFNESFQPYIKHYLFMVKRESRKG